MSEERTPYHVTPPPVDHGALSAKLAAAIGYTPDCVRLKPSHGGGTHCLVYWPRGKRRPKWRVLDYRSPEVCVGVLTYLLNQHNGTLSGATGFVFAWSHADGSMAHGGENVAEAVARAAVSAHEALLAKSRDSFLAYEPQNFFMRPDPHTPYFGQSIVDLAQSHTPAPATGTQAAT